MGTGVVSLCHASSTRGWLPLYDPTTPEVPTTSPELAVNKKARDRERKGGSPTCRQASPMYESKALHAKRRASGLGLSCHLNHYQFYQLGPDNSCHRTHQCRADNPSRGRARWTHWMLQFGSLLAQSRTLPRYKMFLVLSNCPPLSLSVSLSQTCEIVGVAPIQFPASTSVNRAARAIV